ncbi:MAG: DUF58 domain-containing protein [Thiothrix sp.]|nr:MAG: DUF58 domain-containing protein [Thiothrix sp.]
MILPARRSFYLISANLALAVLVSFLPSWLPLWYLLLGISLGLWLVDSVLALQKHGLEIERQLPASLPVGIKRLVQLRLRHTSKRPLNLVIYDHYPQQVQAQGLPLQLNLPSGQYAEPVYSVLPVERGKFYFPKLQVRVLSPLQLWWHDYTIELASEIRVYPNFAAISQYALLATDNHLSHLGIMKRRRRGEGQDFHQLREYRAGDSLRQIDWKASARMHKAISREYQDERDQEIVFLLDCGHRMQAKDGELSHFDHTLNAILLMSYVALKQGDAVGLATFGGTERWLPVKKGQASLNQMLNTLYDLQPSLQAPDYSQAATELLIRHKKRALVILITNLRDEDTDDLLPALNLLRKRHLLLLVSMRELALDQKLAEPVDHLEEAIEQAATQHYLQLRQQTLERVRATGTLCLDVPPTDLSTQLINRYLEIKRSGSL